jgi:hypothetical protein
MPFHRFLTSERVRGSVLAMTLFFLVLLSFFALAFWKLIPVELHAAQRHRFDTQAYYVADYGVADTLLFLKKKTQQGNIDSPTFDDGPLVRTGTLEGWDWTATITPGPGTYGAPGVTAPNPIRCYEINCVASRKVSAVNTQNFRRVRVWAMQQSFTEYGYFVDNLPSDIWLNLATFTLDGKYHTNHELLVYAPDGFDWKGPSSFKESATFSKSVSNSSLKRVVDGVKYRSFTNQVHLPYNKDNGLAIAGRYERIATEGAAAIQQREKIPIPESSDDVAAGAYGTTPPADSALTPESALFGNSGINARLGATAPGGDATSGIYIRGDVDQIEFALDPQGNQIADISQGSNMMRTTFVTESVTLPAGVKVNGVTLSAPTTYQGTDNDNLGYTIMRDYNKVGDQWVPTNEYKVYNRQTNGVIYATGDINGIRGTVKGRRTVATKTTSGSDKVLRINGELLYAGTTPGEAPTSTADQLGLISYAVRMKGGDQGTVAPSINTGDGSYTVSTSRMWPPRNTTSAADPHYLYCSIFSGRQNDTTTSITEGGGFAVENSSDSSYDAGLGIGKLTLFGSLSEGVRQRKGTIDVSGYNYEYKYDVNLRLAQPPFFPSLPSYGVVSWEEESFYSY